ncbi:putative protein serine/threonine kinase [Cavenderia fasciculata]|uniref:non-specific serine/threonine protein kinase n=1 Tax=Cavenderia fasciculata TaxID=261658 RepID=F4QED4_CACFS|nr:putative protein serine/threonine kinase [Cavenderia fasciculata]EGG14081.1 putative protein serine/threonine kinase [Cavenderia fasciculata]|eukprot:XP_004350789.1 putative protein serine/threonine kinase [Cavenderia fasciculata]
MMEETIIKEDYYSSSDDEEESEDLTTPAEPPSRPTMDKSLAAKMYIEQYYLNQQKSVRQRESRRKDLEVKMGQMNITPKEKSEMMKELDKKESDYMRLKRIKMKRNDFEVVKVIGRGAFGEVSLVRLRETGELYAMKKLLKSEMLQKEQVAHVRAERDVLANANNDWVVRLYYSFQDDNYLYLIMEYLPGGDMMSLLIKYDIFSEAQAKFYIAETLLAIELVHSLDYIHRDIKPDNLLLDKDGHVKLTDFGLCTGFHRLHSSEFYNKLVGDAMTLKMKLVSETPITQTERIQSWKKARRELAYSAVGTPDYTAPEVFMQVGYGKEVDWWSLGVILYEMVIGHPPFLSDDTTQTCLKIINCKETLHFPQNPGVSNECIDLIKRLVTDHDRLKTPSQIKQHPFFKGINWDKIKDQKAPFIPELKGPTDTSHFDEYEPDEEIASKLPKSKPRLGKLVKEKDLAFIGYTYKGFDIVDKSPSSRRKVDQIFK